MVNYRPTLTKYILKSFAFWNGIIAFILSVVAILFNLIELMRKAGHHHNSIKFGKILKAVFLSLPTVLDQLSPLIVLFATMGLLWSLHKKYEIVVMRSLGYSIWSVIKPMILGVFLYSLLYFSFLNPLAATFKEEYGRYYDHIFHKSSDLSGVSKSGLWLKHIHPNLDYSIIHITRLVDQNTFGPSTIYSFSEGGQFLLRYDVEKILVRPHQWYLENPTKTESNDIQQKVDSFIWENALSLDKIHQTFHPPASLSFWKLPKFIALIKKTGLSSMEHSLYFFNLLMKPWTLLAMVLIGGVCAFASVRQKNGFIFILSGIFSGFFLHFFHQIFYALGESLKIPLFFAVLTPTFVSLLIGIIILIHLEEG